MRFLTLALISSALALAPDFAEQAKQASEKAWEHAKELKTSAKDAAKISEEVKAAGEGAKAAMEKAKELDAQMSKLYESTRQSTVAAASAAAMAYYQEVKQAGAQAVAEAARPVSGAEEEERVAKAAIEAAMPYHEAQVVAQKRAADYQLRAQAMSAAGNQLQVEGVRLAPSAAGYQQTGKPKEANQIIMTAHMLVDQGLKLKRQAKTIHQTAVELNDALPAYRSAEQAATLHAAAMAAGPLLPTNAPPY
ncbi:unnamed protein product [Effrenium voratum]|nr:unnamed protein product [Effrenium voratum]